MENLQKNNNIIIIRMDELIHWVMKRIIWILLAGALLAAAGGYYASRMKSTPMYRTSTKLYVTGVQTFAPSTGNFALGKQVINSYMEIMKSRPVLEEVITNLGLNMSSQQLKNCISARVLGDTCMLEVTLSFPEPEWAKKTLDELVVSSAEYAFEIMGCTPPTVFEESVVPTAPYNTFVPPVMKYALLGGVAGVALAGFLVLVLYFLNTKFDTPGKAEDKLSVPVWGVLPKEEKFKQGARDAFVSRLFYEAGDAKLLSFVRATAKENTYDVMSQIVLGLREVGKKVICIDTNLSNPLWSMMTKGAEATKGLSEYLTGAAEKKDIVCKTEGEPDKILCGAKVLNSGELLKSPAFGALLAQLKEEYDYIFLDVPPVQYGMDAFVVTEAAEKVLWVLSAKKTKTYVAKNVKKSMDVKEITTDGLVLSGLSVRRGGGFFKKKYGTYVGIYRK